MDWQEYPKWSAEAADWIAAYHQSLREQPVCSQAKPGDTLAALPEEAPDSGESMDAILADFKKHVPPGLTHWQHPRFFAYFQANTCPPSAIAEQLCAALGVNSMLWLTSPVATEMEIRMIEWLRQMSGLPAGWRGTIQDTASMSSLVAILTARERALEWNGSTAGLAGSPQLRIYISEHSHSSIGKAAAIAGLGRSNTIAIPADETGAMQPAKLVEQIASDRAAGMLPAALVGVVGGTSTGCSDKLRVLGEIAQAEGLYFHVDAAWAGSAMICPEFRDLIDGIELADSYVFNPHKWLGAQFDCSAHFIKDPSLTVRTMAARPDYLRTFGTGETDNFSEWTVQLGRRFRALKLWFVIRSYGCSGLQKMIRNHVAWAAEAADKIRSLENFQIASEPVLGLFSFRHLPDGMSDEQANKHNESLLRAINAGGCTFLTQTSIGDKFVIRMNIGQTDTTRLDVQIAVDSIADAARSLPQA